MSIIRVLDKHVAELIAAGEVVERPASVVKEMVENSIDAGAKHITVEIRDGGVSYIRITDDGCGIHREDVPTAFLRHATSKVSSAEDLNHIGTLGFRGEALASVAAVSKVEVTTCARGEIEGTHYVIHGGVYNWFLNVDDPPGTFLVEIGYRSRDRQFFSLVSSNTVVTPQNYIQESMGWSESAWNMLTASTMVSPFEGKAIEADHSPDAEHPGGTSRPRRTAFSLAVDAEVVIKGQTSPDAQLTVRGERIFLREDGTFLIRYHLPERRHVFPVAAVSRDGIDTKTIVLSVERNTKNLETAVRSQSDDD